jgi:hypothetical protein
MTIPDPTLVDWVPLWSAGPVAGYVPAAKVRRSANSSNLTVNVWNQITWTVTDFDTDTIFAPGAPTRLTCKTAGKYLVGANVALTGSTAGIDKHLAIQKNGTWFTRVRFEPAGTDPPEMCISSPIDMIVGDYVDCWVFPGADAACQVYFENAWTPQFWMAYLGPNVALGAVIPPTYGTSLPASPADGQEAILVDSLTNPTYQWRFRYNAGSTSPYKWEFIGGADAVVTNITAESTTTVGSWLDLATVGPRVIVPRAGEYDVQTGAGGYHSVASATIWISSYIGTATAGSGQGTLCPAANQRVNFLVKSERWTLAAGDDIRMRYHNSTAGTASWIDRAIRVKPVRVS